ncbi:MAG: rhomboid family intramembrane serine protease [Pseudomonadota bacterium]
MPFIPLDDTTQGGRVTIQMPWVTWGFMVACFVMFWVQSLAGQEGGLDLIYGLGVIPLTIIGQAELAPSLYLIDPWLTLFTYNFLHGGLLHLAGNLLYLWVFGDNVEDAMGHGRFAAFFMLCGALAALVHVMVGPDSPLPLIGASGAISGVLGAYLILHPKAKVMIPIFFIPVNLPAWSLLIFWIGFQVFSALTVEDAGAEEIAWWAHIGGFVIGMILVVPFRYKTVALFGRDDLPGGITLRDRSRWRHRAGKRSGPWEKAQGDAGSGGVETPGGDSTSKDPWES